MEHKGLGWTLCTADTLVTIRPAILEKIVLHALVDGGDVAIYNGRDASGQLLGIFHGLAGVGLPVKLGVLCEQGIYVDFPDYSGANLILNPGFETAGAGAPDFWANWTESVGSGAIADELVLFHSGAHAAKLTAGVGTDTFFYQSFAVTPGTIYQLTFWTRGDGINGGMYELYDATNAADIVALTHIGIVSTTYAQFSKTFTTPAGCVLVTVFPHCNFPTVGGIVYFDDVSVLRKVNVTSCLVIWKALEEP